MNESDATWEELKSDYLRQVEQALDRVDHPRKQDVLEDLGRHLELRLEELAPEARTAGRLKQLIEEMGPPEEYAELLAPDGASRARIMLDVEKRNQTRKAVPLALWVAIVALGMIAVIHLMLGVRAGSTALLTAFLLEAILTVGLASGQKWAYILVLVFSVLAVLATLVRARDFQQGLMVLVGDAIVLLPMIMCTGFFFPKRQRTVASSNAGTRRSTG